MKVGTEDKKKLATAVGAGAVALGAVIYLYVTVFAGPSAPPPQTAPVIINGNKTTIAAPVATGKSVASPPGFAVAKNAQKVGSTSGELDPTLHMEAMHVTESLVYSGSGRNIFGGSSVASTLTKIKEVKPKFDARPPVQQAAVYTGPPPIPPPPPINLKFFGTSTDAQGIRKAFLLQGDDVFLAATGDVVQRKYRVISISPTTILIEDIPNSNKQTLPMIPN